MVRGRPTPTRLALAIALMVLVGLSCVKRQTAGSSPARGTCEGACRHYTSCKKTDDPAVLRECVRDCAVVYTDDSGEEDSETLGLFERLDCEETISFVEGTTAKN